MLRDELSVLAAFAVVAEERSFTKAAVRLGVSTSAISHSIRGLEERLRVRLLARTTRTVAPTEAGQRLLAELRPAFDNIEGALDDVTRESARPSGTIRLIGPTVVVALALAPKLAPFMREYPAISLDITTEDDSRRDLVAGRFDAGMHLGEFLQRDMVAVKVGAPWRAAIVAAPEYCARHGRPKTPRDLTAHQCITYRMGAGAIYNRWEFEKRGKELSVAVAGPLVIDDVELILRATLDGIGISYQVEEYVAGLVAAGKLVRVLEDWCAPFDGVSLYYPSRHHQPAALQALIDFLRK